MARQLSLFENPLVFIAKNDVFTDSLIVASEFEKRHKDVLRAIERRRQGKIPEVIKFTKRNFALSEYLDKSGRTLKKYEMTEDGFLELAMSFTGEKAMIIRIRFIAAFRELRNQIANPPRQGLLQAKRDANDLMNDALLEYRAELGKQTDKGHYQCEAKLCNWAVTGSFEKIDEKSLPNDDLALLEKVRQQNRALIDAGMDYDDRKKALNAFAIRKRTKRLGADNG
jgi:Rha family phage regulatory protein